MVGVFRTNSQCNIVAIRSVTYRLEGSVCLSCNLFESSFNRCSRYKIVRIRYRNISGSACRGDFGELECCCTVAGDDFTVGYIGGVRYKEQCRLLIEAVRLSTVVSPFLNEMVMLPVKG